jgi:hypothetical protein
VTINPLSRRAHGCLYKFAAESSSDLNRQPARRDQFLRAVDGRVRHRRPRFGGKHIEAFMMVATSMRIKQSGFLKGL